MTTSHPRPSLQIVNLVSNDVRRFDDAATFFCFLIAGPVLLVVVRRGALWSSSWLRLAAAWEEAGGLVRLLLVTRPPSLSRPRLLPTLSLPAGNHFDRVEDQLCRLGGGRGHAAPRHPRPGKEGMQVFLPGSYLSCAVVTHSTNQLLLNLTLEPGARGGTTTHPQGLLVRYIGRLRAGTAAQTDERVRLTGEVIGGVLAAKMLGWEDPLLQEIRGIRRREADVIRRMALIRALNLGLSFAIVPIVSAVGLDSCPGPRLCATSLLNQRIQVLVLVLIPDPVSPLATNLRPAVLAHHLCRRPRHLGTANRPQPLLRARPPLPAPHV